MNRLAVIWLFLFAKLAGAQSEPFSDTSTFNFVKPKIGDYLNIIGARSYCEGDCNERFAPVYDTVARFINRYPNLVFQLSIHTDCRASAEYNLSWSQRIADTIRNQLLLRLTDTTQLPTAIGKGEDEPLIGKCRCDLSDYKHTCTEAEHQQNRRTILRVIALKDSSIH